MSRPMPAAAASAAPLPNSSPAIIADSGNAGSIGRH
jgi:hypothetical protein